MYDVLIIGCGVIGSAMAYTLSRYQLKVCVCERFNDVANGVTKANSAILHAGFFQSNFFLIQIVAGFRIIGVFKISPAIVYASAWTDGAPVRQDD